MHRRSFRRTATLAATLLGVALTGCASSADLPPSLAGPSATGHVEHVVAATAKAPTVVPLRSGERFLDMAMPAAYTPSSPTPTGHDDYRCFLLDPKLTKRVLVDGVDIVPGNPKVVHHVIVFKVAKADVAGAEAADAATPGPGWTCFGDAGISRGGPGTTLDNAPWVGAWAPGGGERVLPHGVGIPLDPGTQIVMQVHYNLLVGTGPDTSRARLRVSVPSATSQALDTMLLPASVELPCRSAAGSSGLCNRTLAVADVRKRFGEKVATADLLHLLCGPVLPGPTQSCTRTLSQTGMIRAVAGHMHLLGRSISVVLDKGKTSEQTVLDIPVWNFDDQASTPLPKPVAVKPGDTLTVSCTHDQSIRDALPSFKAQPERYVVWGEGTTDEMCLGIVLWTRS
ncbi:MAG: hypothetical protein ABI131_01775 [Nostocoides sp.]